MLLIFDIIFVKCYQISTQIHENVLKREGNKRNDDEILCKSKALELKTKTIYENEG